MQLYKFVIVWMLLFGLLEASQGQSRSVLDECSKLSRFNLQQMKTKMGCITHCLQGNVLVSRVFPLDESLLGIENDRVRDLVRYVVQCRIDDRSISRSYCMNDHDRLLQLNKELYANQIKAFMHSEVEASECEQKKFEKYKNRCENNAGCVKGYFYQVQNWMSCYNDRYMLSLYRLTESESLQNQVQHSQYFNETKDLTVAETRAPLEIKEKIVKDFREARNYVQDPSQDLMESDRIYLTQLLQAFQLSIDEFDPELIFHQEK